MNSMKLFRLFVFGWVSFFAVAVFPVFAQNARGILDRAAEEFRKADGIKAGFTMQMGGDSQSLKGTISLQGEKFVLDVAGVKTWFNGHTQWSYVKANAEVNVSEPTSEELHSLNPYAWLSLYKEGYQIRLLKSTDKVFEVSMESADPQQAYRYIWIELDKRTYFPLSVRIQHGMSELDSVEIRIVSFYSRQHYADSFFNFHPEQYPDVEVIDLR